MLPEQIPVRHMSIVSTLTESRYGKNLTVKHGQPHYLMRVHIPVHVVHQHMITGSFIILEKWAGLQHLIQKQEKRYGTGN
jgi:hypothetical protein